MAAADRLRAVWARVHAFALSRSRRVPGLSLRVGCRQIARRRAAGDPRAFFHTNHYPNVVCASPEAAALDDRFLVGLYLHEIAHHVAWRLWKRSEQADADRAVRMVFSVRIHYAGPLLLERVSAKAARRILGWAPS